MIRGDNGDEITSGGHITALFNCVMSKGELGEVGGVEGGRARKMTINVHQTGFQCDHEQPLKNSELLMTQNCAALYETGARSSLPCEALVTRRQAPHNQTYERTQQVIGEFQDMNSQYFTGLV